MLRYQLEGSGEPLLLIHGWGVTYVTWQNLVPLLKPYFQLILIELPGNGRSPDINPHQPYYPTCAELIEELRQSLGIEQWSVLAYSTGTRVAEAYLQRYAQNVKRAVFLCPIYLTDVCCLALRILDNALPRQPFSLLTSWILSDWRLYTLILALGFNGKRHAYTYLWQHEIELQPVTNLTRMLCELPGKGRAPFELPSVPVLFCWGSRDSLTARPRRPRANDVFIPADHSAPMLAPHSVAEVVVPFLCHGELVSSPTRVRSRAGNGPFARARGTARLRRSGDRRTLLDKQLDKQRRVLARQQSARQFEMMQSVERE